MKRMNTAIRFTLGCILCSLMLSASGQDAKSYKEGPVTELSYIKIKSGKFDDYMKFLDTSYKALMEENKKAGLILGYKVYAAQARSPREADLILATTYANMAALDKADEGEAVAVKVLGSSDAQNKASMAREAMREVLGSELIRELILK
jgi:hypothetical protein